MASKRVTYSTRGTCSSLIEVEIDEDGILRDVQFTGGCNGNLQGICSLGRGMNVEDVKAKLRGIRCGYKNTSCPDQLVCAIEKAQKEFLL